MVDFTPDSLPAAIATLFRQNHHTVGGPLKINGAEIDLVATPIGNPFASKVYIEATVQYVDNTKYGKDLTKLSMVHMIDPGAICLIVSSNGFTPDVRERAAKTRIETLTYSELFEKFEKFQPYVELITGDTQVADQIRELSSVYEHPKFVDAHGSDNALEWMDKWLHDHDAAKSWLLVVGEYGTGKSALTRMLQKRWLESYKQDPGAAIPVRIELGAFTKQFDAQGLLHHFLDHNGLSHVPIEFFWSLIRSGRVVLILDGYDEMAQYLNQRERRATLQALAELSSDGVRGLLTSRPNYFSETEQLALFDHLYKQISLRSKYAIIAGEKISQHESQIDDLIQRSILDKFERSLMDLSPDQAKNLVRRMLTATPEAAETVIAVLDRVFRATGEGTEIALSGKPVIISYLIEVANELDETTATRLTEWEVYTLIVDKLGLRDLGQAAHVGTDDRRVFLQQLAIHLTTTGQTQVDEDQFRSLIEVVFKRQLRRHTGSSRSNEVDSMFEDLRRSGTLTRAGSTIGVGWRFSHNSLREFLVAESMVDDILRGRPLRSDPPISDAMRAFTASAGYDPQLLVSALVKAKSDMSSNLALGSYIALIWDGLPPVVSGAPRLQSIAGEPPRVDRVHLASMELTVTSDERGYEGSSFRDCTLLDISFRSANLRSADFSGSALEAVILDEADLSAATFHGASLVDVSVTDAILEGAIFTNLNEDISLILDVGRSPKRVEGKQALGYLAYCGAVVDPIDSYFFWMNHPRFSIVEKVASKLVEGSRRQRRGLEQRGAAALDPAFARSFVAKLESLGYVQTPLGRSELVEITASGRSALGSMQSGRELPSVIAEFLAES
ncbi:NACHT domain-containing protein [Rathayibacter sp. VKM Ac-2835]|uniref:pentapeptide repeat-containing protein n=1 Tax=Rathayibacter sp. VKM Ac-2835 TaxID=2739043 RepID=UPI0015654393|nr:pentapeptide repeat-containing protein [Rathayibacter sp. VKM Ac-2835]NRG42297.1 NACHT domain-containing protein [Rathayibacter sp. VKM Ac-2835]